MSNIKEDASKIIATIGTIFNNLNSNEEVEILSAASIKIEEVSYDNWNEGSTGYGIYLNLPIEIFSKYASNLKRYEDSIRKQAETVFRAYPCTWPDEVVIAPMLTNHFSGKDYKISHKDLLNELDQLKALMIAVSTGGPKIQQVNNEYIQRKKKVDIGIKERNINDFNPYADLWRWYSKWSTDLSSYQSRRDYISELFAPIIGAIDEIEQPIIRPLFEEPTGWARVDRGMNEVKVRLSQANTEEQFQAIGLLCRDTLISLAQEVFNEESHSTDEDIKISKTDSKRMLDAFISNELAGKENQTMRKYAKSTLDLANELTHKRTATFRISAMCAESTNALVNIISIIVGQRDKTKKTSLTELPF